MASTATMMVTIRFPWWFWPSVWVLRALAFFGIRFSRRWLNWYVRLVERGIRVTPGEIT